MKKEVILFGVVFSVLLSVSAIATDCSTTGLEICGIKHNCQADSSLIQSISGFSTYCKDKGCPLVSPPPCTPNCNCAGSTCQGNTCSNGCGGVCWGTKDCSPPPPPPPPSPPGSIPTVDGHAVDACYDGGSGADCSRKSDAATEYCKLNGYTYASSFTEGWGASSIGGTIYLPSRRVCSACEAYFTSISCSSTPPCTANTYYRDSDGDGYGNPSVSTSSCTQPGGYVSNNQDCDDSSSAIKPGAVEVCNDGKDNNCNGKTDGNQGANSDSACCIYKGASEDWCNVNSNGNLVAASREVGNCDGIINSGCDTDGDGYINYQRVQGGKLYRLG